MINFLKKLLINIKDKKGFTLVEIIVCIALIAMISTLIIIVLKKENKNPEYEEYIILASRVYDETQQYEKRCIKLEYIIKDGYLTEENIKNEDKNKYIIISSNEEGYRDYTITNSCTERLKITLNDENNLSYLYFDTDSNTWHNNSTITTPIDKINIPTKTNKYFGGFFTEKDGNGENIIDDIGNIDTTKKLSNDIVLYAYWTNTYIITLDNVGGSSTLSSLFYKKDSWYKALETPETINSIADNLPQKSAYKFDGYYLDVNDSNTKYIDSNGDIDTNISVNSDITLFAKWIQKKYTVNLNNNGATKSGTNTIYLIYNDKWYSNGEYKNTITSINKPTKNGYSFNGYFTENNGNGEQIINKDGNIIDGKTTFTTINEDNISLYANWDNGIYRITLNNQSATTSGTNEIYLKYNNEWCATETCSKNINKITIPTKKGYVFNGYYTSANGKGTKIIDENGNILEQKTFTTNNSTIYANWIPNTYTILYGGKITQLPLGTQVTVKPNNVFKVSGNSSNYTETIIYQNGNEAKSLQIKIQFYLAFRGYAIAVKRTCKMTYQASYNGNYFLNFEEKESCITTGGYHYYPQIISSFKFDSNGEILFKHYLKLDNTLGYSNTLALNEMQITIISED